MSYTINASSFSVYNMTILSSTGALDIPKRLGEVEYDWGDTHGVEAYASVGDLSWDGREIILTAYYNGSNFITDIETLMLLKGSNQTLITTFGTHTCRLSGIKVIDVFKVNEKILVEISFFEPVVPVSSPREITGGSGISLAGYDFVNDFGLHVKSVNGFADIDEYYPRNLSYGNTSKIPSGYRKNRTIKMELNGKYMTLAALISSVNNLRYVLQSPYTKSLIYKGITKSVYFTEGAKVDASPKLLYAKIALNLKIQE